MEVCKSHCCILQISSDFTVEIATPMMGDKFTSMIQNYEVDRLICVFAGSFINAILSPRILSKKSMFANATCNTTLLSQSLVRVPRKLMLVGSLFLYVYRVLLVFFLAMVVERKACCFFSVALEPLLAL